MGYTREDGCRAWLTCGGLQSSRLRDLLYDFGTAAEAYDALQKEGAGILRPYCTDAQLKKLLACAESSAMHDRMQLIARYDMQIVCIDDSDYPHALLDIPDPPVLLYYIGDPTICEGRAVTMVGARNASIAGCEAAQTIAHDLSDAGVTIVSGLALGIDAASHTGCLLGKSPTCAVLGCGLDLSYPASNSRLRKEILDKEGVLFSEYPPGTPARKEHFRTRNRILSGLSRATLMVECRVPSGTLLTVHHALDQGREVFAWGGNQGTEWAEGAHQLIREGARFMTRASDLLEDLGWESEDLPTPQQKMMLPPVDASQKAIWLLLRRGEMSMEQIMAETAIPADEAATALTMLQLLGYVKALPGKMFTVI